MLFYLNKSLGWQPNIPRRRDRLWLLMEGLFATANEDQVLDGAGSDAGPASQWRLRGWQPTASAVHVLVGPIVVSCPVPQGFLRMRDMPLFRPWLGRKRRSVKNLVAADGAAKYKDRRSRLETWVP